MNTKNRNDEEPIDPEVVGDSMNMLQKLPPDLVLMKMENESMMAMAASRPRNHKAIIKDLAEQLEAYPSFAAEAIYMKPVGRDENGVMKFAEGLSIRSAESIREAYGFNRVSTSAEPVPDDTDKLRLTATFVDYQKGMVWQDSVILTPWYKNRSGKMTRMPDDRFFNLYVKAQRSILVREVILRSVPAGLKSELFERASRAMDQGMKPEVIEKIVGEFSKMGVTQEMLEGLLGDKTTANWTKADQKTIVGLWQAIKDGETTVAQAFGLGDSKPLERPEQRVGTVTPEGGITAEALANATATVADDQPPPPAEAPKKKAESKPTPAPKAETNVEAQDPAGMIRYVKNLSGKAWGLVNHNGNSTTEAIRFHGTEILKAGRAAFGRHIQMHEAKDHAYIVPAECDPVALVEFTKEVFGGG